LGEGDVKGLADWRVLKAEEGSIPIDVMLGTSSGSMIADI
jgi:predicted acylesterase/phospholipase RssA